MIFKVLIEVTLCVVSFSTLDTFVRSLSCTSCKVLNTGAVRGVRFFCCVSLNVPLELAFSAECLRTCGTFV